MGWRATQRLALEVALACAFALGAAGCESRRAPPPAPAASGRPAPADGAPAPAARLPAAARLLALGDLHGDLPAARAALALAGLTDVGGHWRGGKAVLVQTGDVLDRGDDERALLDWLEQLRGEAARAGGAVHLLLGNHELMNAAGDLRYVSSAGFAAFAALYAGNGAPANDPALLRLPAAQRGRLVAFRPGGPYARKLAHDPVVLQVGGTVFVHAGLLPSYARHGPARINRQVARWLWGGRAAAGRALVSAPDSPVWLRRFADHPDAQACAELDESLRLLAAARMVVGHTTVPTMSAVCQGKLWRIDVGMAAYHGGKPAVLQITAEGVAVLDGARR